MAWTDPHASERWHSLDQDPAYAGKDRPGTHELTSYSPAGNGPKDEVHRVTSNLSFISRTLFIITEDKHFEDYHRVKLRLSELVERVEKAHELLKR